MCRGMSTLRPRQLGQPERRVRIRHNLGRRVVDKPIALERELEVPVELDAVPLQELGAGDALGRILGVEIEGQPLDGGAEPALEPLGRPLADATEGSDVVRPDQDLVGRQPISLRSP